MNSNDFARRCLQRAFGSPPPFELPRAPLEAWLAFIEYGLHRYGVSEPSFLVMLGWDFQKAWDTPHDDAWDTFKRRFVRICRALGFIEPARARYLITGQRQPDYIPSEEHRRTIDILRWYYFPTFVMTNQARVWTFTLPSRDEGEKDMILTFKGGTWKTHHEYPDVMWQPGER